MASHSDSCSCCSRGSGAAQQSLEELAFERGLAGAALRGDATRLEQLLARRGADPDETSQGGYTPLMYAARAGHVEACRVLLQAGADPNRATTQGKATALHRAAYTGHADVVRLLLRSGADVELRDADGLSALQKAEKQNKHEVVDILKSAT